MASRSLTWFDICTFDQSCAVFDSVDLLEGCKQFRVKEAITLDTYNSYVSVKRSTERSWWRQNLLFRLWFSGFRVCYFSWIALVWPVSMSLSMMLRICTWNDPCRWSGPTGIGCKNKLVKSQEEVEIKHSVRNLNSEIFLSAAHHCTEQARHMSLSCQLISFIVAGVVAVTLKSTVAVCIISCLASRSWFRVKHTNTSTTVLRAKNTCLSSLKN